MKEFCTEKERNYSLQSEERIKDKECLFSLPVLFKNKKSIGMTKY